MPLLARYVGGLPSTGKAVVELQGPRRSRFPPRRRTVKVEKGREPKSETVISFFADPPANDPMEQERVLAAADVLEIALRDILREELGQTYTVSVGSVAERCRSAAAATSRSASAPRPENIEQDDARACLQEVQRLAEGRRRPRIWSTAPKRRRGATTRRS